MAAVFIGTLDNMVHHQINRHREHRSNDLHSVMLNKLTKLSCAWASVPLMAIERYSNTAVIMLKCDLLLFILFMVDWWHSILPSHKTRNPHRPLPSSNAKLSSLRQCSPIHMFLTITFFLLILQLHTLPGLALNSGSSQSPFPVFSYCSYIFESDERHLRQQRSTHDEAFESNKYESSSTPMGTESHRHAHHHQSRPYPIVSEAVGSHRQPQGKSMENDGRSTPFPGHASNRQSTISGSFPTIHGGHTRARRGVSEQSGTSPGNADLSSSLLPEPGYSTGTTDFFRSTDPGSFRSSTMNLDQQQYYQHAFQHQFHFSYSPPNNSHPVFIGLEIIDVDFINDAKNFFSLQMHLFELWVEPRLNTSALQMFWDTNSDPIPVNEANIADCLWTPSLVFEDSSESEQLLPPTTILLAYKDKVMLRKSKHSLKVRCHMNLQIYPMDKHHCHFKLRTFTDPLKKVDLRWLNDGKSPKQDLLDNKRNRSVIHTDEFTPSLFDIKVGIPSRVIHTWLNEDYSLLDVEFIFERRIIHTLLTVYIPSTLVVTLSWLQFWFDVEAVPGRMSLGIMSTLTIMTQILTNYEKAGNHVTAVDIWLFVCLIMVFLALMEYAVAYTFTHYYDDPYMINEKQIRPSSLSTTSRSDSCYKHENDPYYASGPLRANLLRNSIRNRGHGANTAPPMTLQSATPVVDLDTEPSLFRMKNTPQGLAVNSTNVNASPDKSTSSPFKGISPDPVSQSSAPPPSPLPNQTIDDEERSKLLSSNQTDEDVANRVQNQNRTNNEDNNKNSDLFNNSPKNDQVELARLRMEYAIEQFNALKDEQYENNSSDNRNRAQMLSNTGTIPNDTRGGICDSGKKRKRVRNDTDPNNNNNNNNNDTNGNNSRNVKSKSGKFSTLRRPTLRRQFSSRAQMERNSSGLSEVDYCSRFVFPISFVLFVVIYWIALSFFKLSSD